MIIRSLFLLTFSFYMLCAIDLNNFETRQTVLQDIKKVVQNEESIARAYEKHILNKYDIPSDMTFLYKSGYLGTSISFLGLIKEFNTNFNTFSLNSLKISYALKDKLKEDEGIKTLYESNTFRKRTYYKDNKIHFVLEDAFAKHLFDLVYEGKRALLDECPDTGTVSCIENNHIYINGKTNYLMAYHIDNFKTGPIVIKDRNSFVSSNLFNSIPKGALLIDKEGKRYVKTTPNPNPSKYSAGIEELK